MAFMGKETNKPLNKKRIIFLILMALLLVSGAMLFNAPKKSEIIEVRFPSGAKLQAEVADTPEKLLFGLAFRPGLPEDEGMIFLFEKSGPHKVWTKQFQFHVDLIWVDESKQIVHMKESAEPCKEDPCPWHGPPPKNARYIIEANSGFIQKSEATVGSELVFALRM